jgi:hypothetical protein
MNPPASDDDQEIIAVDPEAAMIRNAMRIRMTASYNRSLDRAMERQFANEFKHEFENGNFDALIGFQDHHMYNRLIGSFERENAKKPLSYLITFNFDAAKLRADVIDHIFEIIEKVVKKKWIRDREYIFTIEVRDFDIGYHVHMWLPYVKRRSEVHREIWSTTGAFMGNLKHLDVKSNYSPASDKNAKKYVMSDKKDKTSVAYLATEKMREKMNIENYYSNKNEVQSETQDPQDSEEDRESGQEDR